MNNIKKRIQEIAEPNKSKWLKKAKRRRRWRWFLTNKFVLYIRMNYAKLKIWWKRR